MCDFLQAPQLLKLFMNEPTNVPSTQLVVDRHSVLKQALENGYRAWDSFDNISFNWAIRASLGYTPFHENFIGYIDVDIQ